MTPRVVYHTLTLTICGVSDSVSLNERGQDELADRLADAIDGDWGADMLEALALPRELADLIRVDVRWAP